MNQDPRNPADEYVPSELGDGTGDESSPHLDANVVDEIAAEAGVEQGDGEPLRTAGERVAARDERRHELDPASSVDFDRRQLSLEDEEDEG